jgi:hypothetical protein
MAGSEQTKSSSKSDKPAKAEKRAKSEKSAKVEKQTKPGIIPSPCMSSRIRDNVSKLQPPTLIVVSFKITLPRGTVSTHYVWIRIWYLTYPHKFEIHV